MIYKKQIIILGFLLVNVAFCQINQDARMLGLNGSYTTLARGYRAVGINPANLAIYSERSRGMIDFSFGLSNNYLSIQNYNILSGSHMDDTTHENYYPKEKILDEFGSQGVRIIPKFKFFFPAFNLVCGEPPKLTPFVRGSSSTKLNAFTYPS